VVNKENTSTALATSGAPSVHGQAVTFTATVSVVSPGSTAVAYPTGTVTFYDNGTPIATGALNASFSPTPVKGAATMADPLAGMAQPSRSGMVNHGSVSLSGNSSAALPCGIYSQISASGNANLTLSGGTYVIEGGGLSISGNASVSGTGVMIVNAGSRYRSFGFPQLPGFSGNPRNFSGCKCLSN
jgi:hypothetical protein